MRARICRNRRSLAMPDGRKVSFKCGQTLRVQNMLCAASTKLGQDRADCAISSELGQTSVESDPFRRLLPSFGHVWPISGEVGTNWARSRCGDPRVLDRVRGPQMSAQQSSRASKDRRPEGVVTGRARQEATSSLLTPLLTTRLVAATQALNPRQARPRTHPPPSPRSSRFGRTPPIDRSRRMGCSTGRCFLGGGGSIRVAADEPGVRIPI